MFSSIINKYMNTNTEVYKKVRKSVKIGGILTVSGGAIIVLFPIILNFILSWQLVIKEGNIFTMIWSSPPIAIPINLYLFNLDNPEEFQRGAKPNVSERGPYILLVSIKHEITEWSADKMSVKFNLKASIDFDAENTKSDINEKLTMLNPVTFAPGATVQNIMDLIPFSFPLKPVVFTFMKGFFAAHGEGVIKVMTPNQLIHGFRVEMIETLNNFIVKPMKWLGLNLPEFQLLEKHLKDNKFGIVHSVQDVSIGPTEMWTGFNTHQLFGRIFSVKDQTTWNDILGRPIWNDPKCNAVRGIEGIWYGTYMNKEDTIDITAYGLGRALTLSYKGLSFVKGSIQWRYWLAPSLFASPDKNPENRCYCTTPHDFQKCDGIYDIGYTQFRAPVVLSHPHLLHASKKLRSSVNGLSPDPNKHQSYFDVNPTLGFPVNAWIGLQINFMVKPISYYYGFGQLPEAIYPFVWIEITQPPSILLDVLAAIGLISFMVIDWGPSLLFMIGITFLGYTSIIGFIRRKQLFKSNSVQNSMYLESSHRIKETKNGSIYPNLYSEGESQLVRPMPPGYDNNQIHINTIQVSQSEHATLPHKINMD